MTASNQFLVLSSQMKPVLVGIAGSVGSGKKQVASLLTNLLREHSFNTFSVEYSNPTDKRVCTAPDSAECVVYHGATLFEDPMFRNKLDVKVFLDVDGDLRVANMRKLNFFHDTGLVEHWNSNLTREKVSSHNFHCDVVMKQRKYADIWLEEITPEKLKLVADLILNYRHQKEKKLSQRREPEEVEVYLDKYQKAPDAPVPDDFM